MQIKTHSMGVPMSHPLGVRRWDSRIVMRDKSGTFNGTADLKLLADKVLSRDIKRYTADWQDFFEERAAIAEYDGALSCVDAEAQAFSELQARCAQWSGGL